MIYLIRQTYYDIALQIYFFAPPLAIFCHPIGKKCSRLAKKCSRLAKKCSRLAKNCKGTAKTRNRVADKFIQLPYVVVVVIVEYDGLLCAETLESVSHLLLLVRCEGMFAATHSVVSTQTIHLGKGTGNLADTAVGHLRKGVAESARYLHGLCLMERGTMAVGGGEKRINDEKRGTLGVLNTVPRHAAQALCSLRTILAVAEGKGLWKFHSVRFK